MTRDVIPGSRSKCYDDQTKLLFLFNGIPPYEVPQILEAVTSAFIEFLQTGKLLYSNKPCTYTRCKERVLGRQKWTSVMGAFEEGGLRISLIDDIYGGHEHIGIGGLRKL